MLVSDTITAMWLHTSSSRPLSEEGILSHASFDEFPGTKNATEFNLCEPQQPIPSPAGHISMMPQLGLSPVPTNARVCMRPEVSGRTQASNVSSSDMAQLSSPWEITPALTPSKRTAFIPSSPRRCRSRASTCFIVSNTSSTVSSTSEATATRSFAMSDFSNPRDPRGCGVRACFMASSNRRCPSPGSAMRLCVDICVFRLSAFMSNVSDSVPSTARSLRLLSMLRREPITLRLHAFHSGIVPTQGRSSLSVRKMFPTTRPM